MVPMINLNFAVLSLPCFKEAMGRYLNGVICNGALAIGDQLAMAYTHTCQSPGVWCSQWG